MKTRVKQLLEGAIIFASLGLILFIIGFSTGHWLESDDRRIRKSSFLRLGLWEACFNDWTYYKDYTGKKYDGCWWMFSYEYRPIYQYLNPTWFLAVQIVMTLTLIFELISVGVLLSYFFNCCPGQKSAPALFFLSGITTLSGFLSGACLTIFGGKSIIDRQWLENPDQNYLSWSFALIVISAFLITFSGMCTYVAAMQVRIQKVRAKRDEPLAGYEMKQAPPKYDR